jgi:hypothetical protein
VSKKSDLYPRSSNPLYRLEIYLPFKNKN